MRRLSLVSGSREFSIEVVKPASKNFISLTSRSPAESIAIEMTLEQFRDLKKMLEAFDVNN